MNFVTRALATFLVLAATPTSAAVFKYQEGDGGLYSATQATSLDCSDPSKNFGLETEVLVSQASPENLDVVCGAGLLRFGDIFGSSAGQIRPGSLIESATLTITTGGNAPSGQFSSVYQAFTSWDEYTVTLASFGDGTGGVAGIDYGPAVATFTPTDGMMVISLDVASIVQNWSNGAENFGFYFRSTGSDGWTFYSDDADNSLVPLLQVSVNQVPEPSSILLAFGALLALLGMKPRIRH